MLKKLIWLLFAKNLLIVRKMVLSALLAFSINGFAQNGLALVDFQGVNIETPVGGITGKVATTDNQPAAFVSVLIKENGFSAVTDENGRFSIRGLKEGVY